MVVEAKNGMGYVKKKFDEPNLRIQGGQVTSIGKDITTFPFKMWGKEPQNSIYYYTDHPKYNNLLSCFVGQ